MIRNPTNKSDGDLTLETLLQEKLSSKIERSNTTDEDQKHEVKYTLRQVKPFRTTLI